MRYYHPFPDVIPHTRAGCSRVTHPSATDPPEGFTVRLECVMHAASVHPEPGSNSRNHSILTSAKRIKSISSLIALSLLFLELYSLSELSRYSIALTCFILISYCSIFKDHLRHLFCDSLIIVSQRKPFVNTFFKTFLEISAFFCETRFRGTAFIFYHAFAFLSSPFLTKNAAVIV